MAHSLVTEAANGLRQKHDSHHPSQASKEVDVAAIRSMAGKMTTFMVRASFEKIHAKLLDSHQGLVQRLVEQTSSGLNTFAPPGFGPGSGQGVVSAVSNEMNREGNREGIDPHLDPPEASLPPVQGLVPHPSSHRGKG